VKALKNRSHLMKLITSSNMADFNKLDGLCFGPPCISEHNAELSRARLWYV